MAIPKAKKKKPVDKVIQIKASELSRQKEKLCLEATQRATLLYMVASRDVLDLNEDQLCEIMETVSLYARHYDNHVIDMADVAETLAKTGVDIRVEELSNTRHYAGIQLLAKRRINV